jgi:hypothetical protein
MKLNHDCIRDLLLFLENNLTINSFGEHNEIQIKYITAKEELEKYSKEDIYYSSIKLVEAEFLNALYKNALADDLIITDITWNGHDYINSIRDPKVWSKIKEKAGDLSNIAFDLVKLLAIEILKNNLGLA